VSTQLKRTVRVAGAVCVAVVLAACGSTSSSSSSSTSSAAASGSSAAADSSATVPVDVGTGTPVQLKTGPLKVGIFMNAQSNQWQQNLAAKAKETAESFGWEATVLDFNFDQQAMSNALQSAASSNSYDAIAVMPIDGQQSCNMLTQTMPESNIVVTVGGTTICGRDLETGDEMWAPGTLSYNTVAPSYDYAKLFLESAVEQFPGPQKVALVVGPEQNGNTITMHALVEELKKTNPEFEITDFINTDYTTPTTFTAVQGYLQANPETTVLLSVYSPDLSRGVVQALQAEDLIGKVKVADMGGAQYSVDQIKAGALQLTMPYYPQTTGANLMKSIKDAQDGKAPVRVNDEIPGGLAEAPVITSSNVDTFTAQY